MNKELVKQAFQLGCIAALEKRAKGKHSDDRGGTRAIGNSVLERLGKFTTLAESTGIGTLLGSATRHGKVRGALVGAGVGILANALGNLGARLSKGRTARDQIDYDKYLRFKNIFIPGLAAYNRIKRKERERLALWHA